ncbi:hypothetical protein MKX03_027028, partial [Papaver bracteatum]
FRLIREEEAGAVEEAGFWMFMHSDSFWKKMQELKVEKSSLYFAVFWNVAVEIAGRGFTLTGYHV